MGEQQGRAVILTALGIEYDAVRAWLAQPRGMVHASGTRYEIGQLADPSPAWEVVLAEIGEGNQAAAVLTGQAIDAFNPHVVLFVGIAGSLVDSVSIGDVVAATRVDAYHGGKAVAMRFQARPVTWPASWRLDQAARQVRREGRWVSRLAEPVSQLPEVHLKPILAGEVVLDSRESRLYRFLRRHYNDAVAVEMEGAGLAAAAHASGAVSAMVIRGISDLTGGAKAVTDAAGWQPRAARHAAAFAIELLASLTPESLPRRVPTEESAKSSSKASVELHELQDVEPEQTEGQENQQYGTVTHLSDFRGRGSRATIKAPDAQHLHSLVTQLSESAELIAADYSSGHTDYIWSRLGVYRQLKQIQSQLDQVTQWLGRTGIADDLSTFDLRHALSRYPAVVNEFVKALKNLGAGLSSSGQRVSLENYEQAAQYLTGLLWRIHREFGLLQANPVVHPS